ncbi:MAG: hypothetical protein ACJAYM_002056 [Flavobacteriales bacterium]|jgi:hypothetical protein
MEAICSCCVVLTQKAPGELMRPVDVFKGMRSILIMTIKTADNNRLPKT